MPGTPTMVLTGRQRRFFFRRGLRVAVLLMLGMLFLFPFYWMLTISIRPADQVFTFPPNLLPFPATLNAYAQAWSMQNNWLYTWNTIKIALCNVILAVLSSAVVAYGFARIRFPGRDKLFALVLATMILPGEVLIIPQYLEFNAFGWLNSHLPLIVPAAFGNPFYIFLIRQYCMGLPYDLDEAAVIDGCSRLRVFWNILLPLMVPALITCCVFQFMASWNDYLQPLLYLSTREQWTLSLGIASMNSEKLYSSVNWGHRMAMATIFSSVPLLIFFLAQKRLIGGIATTGIKG